MSAAPPRSIPFVLVAAVLAISTAAILVRSLSALHPLVIAFWRLTLVSLLLAPALRPIPRGDAFRILLAGVCLAAHFATWFASLQLTTIMRSTVLVCLSPLWAGVFERLQGTPPPKVFWLGVAAAVPGAALMAGSGVTSGSWRGDLWALVGGVLAALYLMLSRSVRPRVGIAPFAAALSLSAALALLPALALISGPKVSFDVMTWLLLIALAAGPQLIGHNGLTYALRYLPASVVSTAVLLEPVGATMLAWLLFAERPPPLGSVDIG